MQASANHPRPPVVPRKTPQERRTKPARAFRAAARAEEPFGPAYGCVEWFNYEEPPARLQPAGG